MKSAIATAVKAAFTAVGDLASTVVYRRTSNVYDPTTGDNAITNSDTTLSAIMTKFSDVELNNSSGIEVTDVKMIIASSSLTITPDMQNDIVIYNSSTYNILQVLKDPADSTYTFQLRAP